MNNIGKYVNSSCRTCVYSIKCPTFAEYAKNNKCKDCPNCNTTRTFHGVLNCRCFEEAPDTDTCPYYKEYKQ